MRGRGFADRVDRSKTEKYAINEQIAAREVRVIDVDGAQLGVLAIQEALRLADEKGVDLVEVAPEAKPPVCRLLDYGKLKYKEQKKAAETRKKSSVHVVKEIRVRYSTDKHDLETKVRNARKFIEDGDKVRFLMRFRGREAVNAELGAQIMDNIVNMMLDISVVDERSPLMGQRMVLVLGPRPKG